MSHSEHDTQPTLSIITTCKGRLAHLKESLPGMVAQAGCEIVLVDYACPQACGAWAEREFGDAVRVVRVTGEKFYQPAAARNAGAAAATGSWFFFCDADKVLEPSFATEVIPSLTHGHYFVAGEDRKADMMGMVICGADDFRLVDGYDDQLQGWSHEDYDLYERLRLSGLRASGALPARFRSIEHDARLRTEHMAIESVQVSLNLNVLYGRIKRDYLALDRKLTIPKANRVAMYRQAAALMVAALTSKSGSAGMNLPRMELTGLRLDRRISYGVQLAPGMASDQDLETLRTIAATGRAPES